MKRFRGESGAAAVEFALLLPILLTLLLGIVEFSRFYNAQLSVSAAAREGARVMAIQDDPVLAEQTAREAASLDSDNMQITVTPGTSNSCPDGGIVKVTVEYPMDLGLYGGVIHVKPEGEGVMRCNG